MQTHMNVNPSLDIVRAMNEGVALSNAAVAASRRGDHATAAELHQQALALKIAGHGEASIQAAISFNGLGEEMLALGRLDEAEHALQSALRVREVGQMSLGLDAAVSRENLAQVYEAKGNFTDAKAIRLRSPSMCCTNYGCPGGIFRRDQLKQCSGCQAAFYCGASCQSSDWKKRHKKTCTADRQSHVETSSGA